MPYEVRFTPAADREVTKLPKQIQLRIVAHAEALADDPRRHGVEKLSGQPDAYRIRVGDYRIIYRIFDDRVIVLVIRVGHRREVYR